MESFAVEDVTQHIKETLGEEINDLDQVRRPTRWSKTFGKLSQR